MGSGGEPGDVARFGQQSCDTGADPVQVGVL